MQIKAQDILGQNQFLNTVLDSLPSLLSYMDRDLNYLYVNSAYEKWFGVSRQQCLKSNMVDVVGQAGVNAVQTYLDAAYRGEAQYFERDIPYKSAGLRHISVTYLPDRESDGQVKGISVIVHDITD